MRVSARLGGECLVSLRRGIGKLGEVSILGGEQRGRPDAGRTGGGGEMMGDDG